MKYKEVRLAEVASANQKSDFIKWAKFYVAGNVLQYLIF